MYISFGGYIHYPGETKRIGCLSFGYDSKGAEHLCGAFLTKRYCSPVEQFAFYLYSGSVLGIALFYNLVPEKRLWTGLIVILCIAMLPFGKFFPDLWGDHIYTGGNDDFYVHDSIPYELKRDWR